MSIGGGTGQGGRMPCPSTATGRAARHILQAPGPLPAPRLRGTPCADAPGAAGGGGQGVRLRKAGNPNVTHVAPECHPGRDPFHGLQHDHTAEAALLLHPLHPHGHRDPLPAAAHNVHLGHRGAQSGPSTAQARPAGVPARCSPASRIEINQSANKASDARPYGL